MRHQPGGVVIGARLVRFFGLPAVRVRGDGALASFVGALVCEQIEHFICGGVA